MLLLILPLNGLCNMKGSGSKMVTATTSKWQYAQSYFTSDYILEIRLMITAGNLLVRIQL